MRKQFFGTVGLTTTSANHIANMAKEEIQSIQNSIKNLSYLKETTEAAGQSYVTKIATSEEDMQNLENKLLKIAQLTQLIAWLREAIKEKKSLIPMSFESWFLEKTGMKLSDSPLRRNPIKEEDVISSWDVNKYNAFITAQTFAAVYGEAVHPDMPISEARKEFTDALTSPVSVREQGRDLTVITLIPAFKQEDVEKQFFGLQKLQREWQAKYNSYRHEIEEAIADDTAKANAEYQTAVKEWSEKYNGISAEWQQYYDSTRKEYNNLKIIIPDTLSAIYAEVSALGK